MIKKVKLIYSIIFLLALALSIASIRDYILTILDIKWASFVLSIIIMILAIWGYYIAKMIEEGKAAVGENRKGKKKK